VNPALERLLPFSTNDIHAYRRRHRDRGWSDCAFAYSPCMAPTSCPSGWH
jgi:hypothetical protein